MTSTILKDLVDQNRKTCSYSFKAITEENLKVRLTEESASVGFLYRHIGQIIHLMCTFLGHESNVRNTTMGQQDTGLDYPIAESRELVESGYALLYQLIEETSEEDWLKEVETPFFGKISRIRLFGHILYHNTYHCGQITLALKRGKVYP